MAEEDVTLEKEQKIDEAFSQLANFVDPDGKPFLSGHSFVDAIRKVFVTLEPFKSCGFMKSYAREELIMEQSYFSKVCKELFQLKDDFLTCAFEYQMILTSERELNYMII